MTMESTTSTERKSSNWPILAGVGAAIGATACCVGPLLLLMMGVSGAWISNLKLLEPYSPFLIAAALGFMALGIYRMNKKAKATDCKEGSYCANPKSTKINKVFTIVAIIFTLMLLATPHVIPILMGSAEAEEKVKTTETVLHLRNMTCNMCSITVRKSLMNLKGVKEAKVTYKPQRAIVTYNAKLVTLKDIVKATTDAGYPSEAQITLDVKNMTCKTCTITVTKSLEGLKGVSSAKVTLNPPRAIVIFDPLKVSLDEIIKATTNAGYPTSLYGGHNV